MYKHLLASFISEFIARGTCHAQMTDDMQYSHKRGVV